MLYIASFITGLIIGNIIYSIKHRTP